MSYIGIDIGTSGIRACAIDDEARQIALASRPLDPPHRNGHQVSQDARLWWRVVQQVLTDLLGQINAAAVRAIAVDGTSGTLLIADAAGHPLAPALMYNDSHCLAEADRIRRSAPANCAAQGASSGLAKALRLQLQHPEGRHILHQADWISGMLTGLFGVSDENNALKTGYDPVQRRWPDWLVSTGLNSQLLPRVVTPGSCLGPISPTIRRHLNVPADTRVIAGTTDSLAAFIATGANQPGQAVTSLGTTLALKLISSQPVFSAEYGIYSHRLGNYWLAGGASNSGGGVLKHFFNDEQLQAMTARLHPQRLTGLDYYPLLQPGERFPHNDPDFPPRLTPRPEDDVEFFQAILEGIAHIEHQAYVKLQQLGAAYPKQVITAGGGSRNMAWNKIRQAMLGVPVTTALHSEACYGSALLARQGFLSG